MRALLINPAFPDTFWGYRHALKFIGKKAHFPPLGLLTVAAMLPEDWELRLIDLNVRRLRSSDLQWADSAWITGMTVQGRSAHDVVRRCKAAGVKTVAGGPLFTCEPEAFDDVDHLVLNEAEVTLPAFLADLEAGCARHCYTNEEKPDVTQTPIPRWDLVSPRDYGSMCVQFSRGCPFDCDFCNVTALFGHRPRTKTPEQITAELDAMLASGKTNAVFFVDDNLIGNKRAARELTQTLQRWRRAHHGVRFYTEASINLADDPKLTADMVDAGFDTVFIGIETPDEESLASCNKRQNLRRDIAADVRKLHRAGLQVQAGFILGFDTDTPSSFARMVTFIKRSGIMTAMVGILQAPVGTKLYQRLSIEGRLLGNTAGDNVSCETNVQTLLPKETLESGYRDVMKNLYSPDAYYQRLKTFLMDYELPAVRLPVTAASWWAFMKITFSLGIVKTGRSYYWRLIGWVLRHRPSHLPLAVRLWVEGYHFREVCRRQLGVA